MEWVGVVALIVSAISLGWQVYTWRQRRKPAALVLLRQEYNAGPALDDYTGALIKGAPTRHTFEIDVRVVNRGDVAFEVEDVGLGPPGNPRLWTLDVEREGHHALVPPGQSLRESFDMAHIPDKWLETGAELQVVGMVRLVSGEEFTSGEPETVTPWALARVRRPPGRY